MSSGSNSEIKYNMELLSLQVEDFYNQGKGIDTWSTSVTDSNLETLPTVTKIVEQHEQIIRLLDLYKQLIYKDYEDLLKVFNLVQEADTNMIK